MSDNCAVASLSIESMTSNSCAMESLGGRRELGETGDSFALPLSDERLTGACIDLSIEEDALEEGEVLGRAAA